MASKVARSATAEQFIHSDIVLAKAVARSDGAMVSSTINAVVARGRTNVASPMGTGARSTITMTTRAVQAARRATGQRRRIAAMIANSAAPTTTNVAKWKKNP